MYKVLKTTVHSINFKCTQCTLLHWQLLWSMASMGNWVCDILQLYVIPHVSMETAHHRVYVLVILDGLAMYAVKVFSNNMLAMIHRFYWSWPFQTLLSAIMLTVSIPALILMAVTTAHVTLAMCWQQMDTCAMVSVCELTWLSIMHSVQPLDTCRHWRVLCKEWRMYTTLYQHCW